MGKSMKRQSEGAGTLMTQTIDPIYSPSALQGFSLVPDEFDMEALVKEHGLQGKVGKNPKTAAII